VGGLNWAEHTIEIDAPIETCFEAIVDYESFPEWQRAVVDTEVLDRHQDGLGKRVNLVVDAKVRKVDYTLDYRYQRPTLIEWDFVEGNGINDADGTYAFEDLGGGRTRATYRFGLEVGIPLPGPVARRAHKQTLKGSVEDLKTEAERRAVTAKPTEPDRDDDPLASKRFEIGGQPLREQPAAERPVEPQPESSGDESVTGAATEVVSASLNLARVVASRSRGAAGGMIGRVRRLRP
jgi:uncharacterized protein YndB with AHSA1/START domain